MKATTKRFMKIMNDLFSAYVKDGKMDNYRIEENIFYIYRIRRMQPICGQH